MNYLYYHVNALKNAFFIFVASTYIKEESKTRQTEYDYRFS